MKCPRCQAENREGARFCRECGATFGAVCSGCGTKVEPGSKFCDSCGASLEATPAPSTARRFASPESYTPKHLAEKILTSKAALEGERKQVTVLFADLKGSMELLADRDPEEARKLLDPVLEHMMEAVHRYEGTVNQVMGDGIMALFGAPLAHEDHAVRACYAALRMQEAVKRYAEGVRRTTGVPVQIRVGVNSGEVVVRSIGSDLHMDYTAVGQTTHLAARMEQMALPGTVLLTPDTLALAEGFVQVTGLGPMAVKGLTAPIEIYELTGASAVRSRLQAAVRRGLSRFVGRDPEVDQLRRALEQARGGHGQVVAVVGEPGVGKSRLVYEFTHSHRTNDWLILEASSVSYGKATSYLPVIDLLKGYFKLGDRDTHREIREKVTGKLLTLDRALESLLPALLALLDVPVEDPEWPGLDPVQRRQRTLDAVKRLVLRESQVQPVLAIFEDLHWIDGETQALLDGLVESLPTARVLLLVNYRPEYRHSWGSKTYYVQLRLDALPAETAGELLRALLGMDPTLEPLERILADRTGGNPLFLEESVRTLVETGALVGERGAYRLAQAPGSIQVPATVQAILAARIDRLPPEDKTLLQSAAVIGKDVPFALLREIAEGPEDRRPEQLARLQAAEFLYEARLFPDLEYTFKHALTHEVAYGSLLHERRRDIHRQIVPVIERQYAERIADQVEGLAHHTFRGELWTQAAGYLRQAAAKARARSAEREAVTCLEQAIAAFDRLPQTHEVLEQAIDVRLQLWGPTYALGEFERQLVHLRDAERLATTLDDSRRRGEAATGLSAHAWTVGEPGEARRWAELALVLADRCGDPPLRAMGHYALGRASWITGDYREAVDHLSRVVDVAEVGYSRAQAYSWITWALADLGEFEGAIRHGRQGMQLAEAGSGAGQDNALAQTETFLANALVLKGEFAEAVPLCERAYALACDRGLPYLLHIIEVYFGYAKAQAGHLREGCELVERGLRAMPTGAKSARIAALPYLGEVLLLASRVEEASAAAEQALRESRESGVRAFEVRARRLFGEIAARRDPPEVTVAERYYHDALNLADRLGMRPLAAHCHAGLAKLFRRTGQHAGSDTHFQTATALYREMGMTYWLEKLEREMAALR